MCADPVGRRPARDRLVGAERILLARADGANELMAPAHAPESLDDLAVLARFIFDAATQLGVPAVDVAWLLERLFTLLASCDERRVEQWDLQTWWDYVRGRAALARRSAAISPTGSRGRSSPPARTEMSARTGGLILVQLLIDLSRAGARADRVLDAPTSEVWIAPWVAHLRRAASTCGWGSRSRACGARGADRAARWRAGGDRRPLRRRAARRDHAHAAVAELRPAEPRLNGLDRLVTRWMNGILFYLDETCRWSAGTRSTSTPSGR